MGVVDSLPDWTMVPRVIHTYSTLPLLLLLLQTILPSALAVLQDTMLKVAHHHPDDDFAKFDDSLPRTGLVVPGVNLTLGNSVLYTASGLTLTSFALGSLLLAPLAVLALGRRIEESSGLETGNGDSSALEG